MTANMAGQFDLSHIVLKSLSYYDECLVSVIKSFSSSMARQARPYIRSNVCMTCHPIISKKWHILNTLTTLTIAQRHSISIDDNVATIWLHQYIYHIFKTCVAEVTILCNCAFVMYSTFILVMRPSSRSSSGALKGCSEFSSE